MLRGIKRKIWNFTNFALHSLQFFTMHYVSHAIQRTKHCLFDFISRVFSVILVKARRDSLRRTIRPYHVPQYPNLNAVRIETKFTYHWVTFAEKSGCKRRAHSDKAKSRRYTALVRWLCRIKAQQTSNTSSHAKQHADACPPVHRVVIPYGANRRIDPLWAHTSPRIRSRIPTERLGSIVGSRGKPESGEPEGEKSVQRGARGAEGRWGRGSE